MRRNRLPDPTSARRTAALLLGCLALGALAEPRPALLHTAPREWKAGEVFLVDGSLAGSTTFSRLVVRYRGPGEDYADVKMELQYGDLYRGTIPAARMRPPGIEYYVEGVTESGERTPIFMTAGKPARVLVLAEDPAGKPAEPVEPREKAEPKEEAREEVKPEPPKKPKKKCKKKDRKCREEAEPPSEPEAKKAPEEPRREAAKEVEPKAAEAAAPPKEEPRLLAKADPTEAEPKKEAPRAEPPRKRSELEEELAIYGAEDTSAVVTRIDEKATRVPQSITTFNTAALKQLGARTVYDVLDLAAGVTVSRDVQGFHRLAVRGLRSDAEVLFLIDGHKLNNFYDGRAPANLPIDDFEAIELIRGPAAAEYGLGNFLAVVNLITRRDDGVRASGSAGLWETFEGHLNAAQAFGGLKLYLDGDVVRQVGYRKPVLKDSLDLRTSALNYRTAQEPAGRTADGRRLVNVGGGAEFAAGGFGKLSASARFLLENRTALIGQYDTVGPESTLDWTTLLVDLAYQRKLGEGGEVRIRLSYGQQATRRHFQLTPRVYPVDATKPATLFPEGMVEEVSSSTRTIGGELGAQLALPANNRLSFGVSAELASLFGYGLLTNYEPGTNSYTGPVLARPAGLLYPTEGTGAAASRFGLGIFVKDVFTPFERLTIEVGVRADLVQLPAATAGTITGSSIAAGFGPRAGIVFAPINSLALKAHYGRAFRAPTPQELAETIPNSDSNQGRLIGNPSLAPAYVDAVEVGFEYAQTVGDARLKLKGSGFFENFTNPIHPVDTTGNLIPYTNRQQGVRVFGAEGEARVELSGRSSVFLNASFFRGEDVATVAAARLLTDTPQARLNAGFTLPLGPYLNFDVTTRFASERRNNSRSTLELIRRYRLPGYALVGASLRTEPILDHLELAVTGQNVFDFDYADDVPRPDRITSGVPREGALVFGTLKVDF